MDQFSGESNHVILPLDDNQVSFFLILFPCMSFIAIDNLVDVLFVVGSDVYVQWGGGWLISCLVSSFTWLHICL